MHIIQMVQEQHAIYFGYAFFRWFRPILQESYRVNLTSPNKKYYKYQSKTFSIHKCDPVETQLKSFFFVIHCFFSLHIIIQHNVKKIL